MSHQPISGTELDVEEVVVDPVQLRRATLASSVGSALEYYDFYIYGLASALIFGQLFFTPLGPAGATIAAFGTYAVGFAARPIGGLIFGSLGDRIGRKFVLILTIALMGGSSMLIGLLPTYETAGIWGAVLLIVLRIAQGLGAGAEQAGATVMISEFAPRKRRGFFAALPFVGIQIGTLLGAGTFALLGMANRDTLLAWLWRVPFLLGAVLIVVAVVIRMRLKESPTFEALEEAEASREAPVRQNLGQAISSSKGNILVGIGLRMGENGNSSIYSALLLAYVASLPQFANQKLIGTWGAVVAALISIFTVVFFGHLSDRLGRVPVYRWGAFFTAAFAFPGFYLLTLGQVWLVLLVMGVGIGIGVQSMLGPQCALLPELFGNAHRFTGVATAREFSAVIAGGIAPLLGATLLAVAGNAWWIIAGYSAILALISFGTTFITPETKGRSLLELNDAGEESVHA
jgi:MHS family metabolite:H+ symporter-like MFS transporter